MDYGSPLLNAIADRRTEEVKVLLKSGGTGQVEGAALALELTLGVLPKTNCSSNSSSPEILAMLVRAGVDVNLDVGKAWQRTVLTRAAELRDLALARAAVASKANPNSVFGDSPLAAAFQSGSFDIVQLLLEAGADPNAPLGSPGSDYRYTALSAAARRPGPKNVGLKMLLRAGAKYPSPNSSTPLVEFGRFYRGSDDDAQEAVDLLLAAGGKIDELDILSEAVESSYTSRAALTALLRRGANPNIGALYGLARRQDFENVPLKRQEILQLLWEFGARPELATRVGPGVLLVAQRDNPKYFAELQGMPR